MHIQSLSLSFPHSGGYKVYLVLCLMKSDMFYITDIRGDILACGITVNLKQ